MNLKLWNSIYISINMRWCLDRCHENFDSLHKILPFLYHFCKRFASIPLGPKLSIDEQICATKVRHSLKQYSPMRSATTGVTNDTFVWYWRICIFLHDFQIFIKKPKSNARDLVSRSNVVIRLPCVMPWNRNYQLYFNNYYKSVSLFNHVVEKVIHMLGTVRTNRIPNKKLTTGKVFGKMSRGTCEEYVANMNNRDLFVISWNDNQVVNMLSTCHGE